MQAAPGDDFFGHYGPTFLCDPIKLSTQYPLWLAAGLVLRSKSASASLLMYQAAIEFYLHRDVSHGLTPIVGTPLTSSDSTDGMEWVLLAPH